MYVKLNTEPRSSNHCYRRKENVLSNISVCILVLVTGHANCTFFLVQYYNVICGLSGCTTFFHVSS